jgi:hypothetical protein
VKAPRTHLAAVLWDDVQQHAQVLLGLARAQLVQLLQRQEVALQQQRSLARLCGAAGGGQHLLHLGRQVHQALEQARHGQHARLLPRLAHGHALPNALHLAQGLWGG